MDSVSRSWKDDVIETLADGEAAVGDDLVEATTDAIMYRLMLLWALEQWAKDRERLHGAERRLRQLMGLEEWHPTEDVDLA